MRNVERSIQRWVEKYDTVESHNFSISSLYVFKGCVCVCVCVCVCTHAQSCLTLCDPMDCSPPGSFVHVIFQARILEWFAISSSRSSPICSIILYINNSSVIKFLKSNATLHTNARNAMQMRVKWRISLFDSVTFCTAWFFFFFKHQGHNDYLFIFIFFTFYV